MQHFWKTWMLPLDPFTRLINGIVTNQLQGVPVVCQPDEFSVFPAPSGQTCAQWAGEYAQLVGGYLNNPESTGDCQFCQYSVGDSFYIPLELSYDNRVRDLFILVSLFQLHLGLDTKHPRSPTAYSTFWFFSLPLVSSAGASARVAPVFSTILDFFASMPVL